MASIGPSDSGESKGGKDSEVHDVALPKGISGPSDSSFSSSFSVPMTTKPTFDDSGAWASERSTKPKKTGKPGFQNQTAVSHLLTVTKDGVSVQIPPSLALLPSDTEAQKAAKKKKLHTLHCLKKNLEEEQEAKKKQKSWLDFQKSMQIKKGAKVKTKSKSGAIMS